MSESELLCRRVRLRFFFRDGDRDRDLELDRDRDLTKSRLVSQMQGQTGFSYDPGQAKAKL